MNQREARRRARGFVKILEIKHSQKPSISITDILEEMLFEEFIMRGVGKSNNPQGAG